MPPIMNKFNVKIKKLKFLSKKYTLHPPHSMTFNFEGIFIVKKDTLFYFEMEIDIEIILSNLCNDDHNVVFKIIDILFLEFSIKQK